MKVFSFHKEVILLSDLKEDTLKLIHHTIVVQAIKRLVDAHDILDLALEIERKQEDFRFQPPWALALSQDLHSIRCELLTRFADAFKPPILLPRYYSKVGRLLSTMDLRV